MTNLTDAEISRRLALAIGWEDVRELYAGYIYTYEKGKRFGRQFDYRDPAVIWPIAERFNCFPMFHAVSNTWSVGLGQWMAHEDTDTAAKAVALAVIKAKERMK